MNLSLQEVDHLLKSLETMSAHDVARAREQRLANFIVLEGENKGFYWFALIQTTFVLIGDS
jgi:hypothetical protein